MSTITLRIPQVESLFTKFRIMYKKHHVLLVITSDVSQCRRLQMVKIVDKTAQMYIPEGRLWMVSSDVLTVYRHVGYVQIEDQAYVLYMLRPTHLEGEAKVLVRDRHHSINFVNYLRSSEVLLVLVRAFRVSRQVRVRKAPRQLLKLFNVERFRVLYADSQIEVYTGVYEFGIICREVENEVRDVNLELHVRNFIIRIESTKCGDFPFIPLFKRSSIVLIIPEAVCKVEQYYPITKLRVELCKCSAVEHRVCAVVIK